MIFKKLFKKLFKPKKIESQCVDIETQEMWDEYYKNIQIESQLAHQLKIGNFTDEKEYHQTVYCILETHEKVDNYWVKAIHAYLSSVGNGIDTKDIHDYLSSRGNGKENKQQKNEYFVDKENPDGKGKMNPKEWREACSQFAKEIVRGEEEQLAKMFPVIFGKKKLKFNKKVK